jgi:DNA-nicking Smr family endonuclease
MKDRDKHLPEDIDLFREAMADVTPMNRPLRVHHSPPKPRPEPVQTRRDERAVMEALLEPGTESDMLETGEELLYLRPGVQNKVMRRLRRGQYSITDSIDLHHMNEATARQCVLEFVDDAHRRRLGCVRIVHGKGLRSRNGPRLKQMTNAVLRRHPAVLAFASCRAVDGGTGAVAVLLRRKPALREP